MNKSQLVEAISKEASMPKTEAEKALNAFIKTIVTTLESGQQVALVGFGTFSVKDRKARSCINPQTGEVIQLDATKVPGFKAGKSLKDAVSRKLEKDEV